MRRLPLPPAVAIDVADGVLGRRHRRDPAVVRGGGGRTSSLFFTRRGSSSFYLSLLFSLPRLSIVSKHSLGFALITVGHSIGSNRDCAEENGDDTRSTQIQILSLS